MEKLLCNCHESASIRLDHLENLPPVIVSCLTVHGSEILYTEVAMTCRLPGLAKFRPRFWHPLSTADPGGYSNKVSFGKPHRSQSLNKSSFHRSPVEKDQRHQSSVFFSGNFFTRSVL